MIDKSLVKKPIVTEKSTNLAKYGKYLFLVEKNTSAIEAKKVVENVYNVKVTSTNVINVKEKKRRFGQSVGVKPGYKKIIMTLKEGQKLDVVPK